MPDAPSVVVSALTSGSQLLVSWSAANNAAYNTAATAYALHMGSVSATLGGGITSTVIGNLQVSTAYTLSVWALSPIGAGSAAVAAVTIPVFAPAAPQSLTAVAFVNGAGASLSWGAPTVNGGAAITGYVLSYGAETINLGATTAATIGGLTPGEEYAFTLRAANSAGAGAAATAAATMPAVLPGAPTGFTASAFVDGMGASLSWSAPAFDGGASVTGYVLSYGSETVTLGETPAVTIGGLAAGGEYAFTLRAQNSVGAGAAATAAASLANVPGAPVGFTANAVAGGASLSWSAPAADGGASLTGYVLAYGDVLQTLAATATAATIGGLTPGGEYAFTLRAGNAVGLGAAATASVAVPAVLPGAPEGFTASAVEGGASLQWSAPASDGGASVTGYVLTYGTETINLGATLAATLGGLTSGGEYAFTLRAGNAVGLGAAATASVAIPAVLPGAPEGFTASAVEGGASLQWSAPASDGGASVTGYVLSYGAETATLDNTLAATVGGLAAGEHLFTLQAANSVGLGVAAVAGVSLAVVPSATAPAAPQSLTAVAGDGLIGLTWEAPNSDGGASITAYIVYANSAAALTASGDASAATLTGLANGATYTLWVNARNSVGESSASNATLATPQAAATAPSVSFATVTALASGTEISVSLLVADGGISLTGLTLLYGGTAALSLSPTTRAAVVGSLSANTAYTLSIVAVNAVGAATAVATATTPAPAATAPGKPSVTILPTPDGFQPERLTLVYTAPDNGGSSVTVFRFRQGIYDQTFPATNERATQIIADPERFYLGFEFVFRVAAINAVGQGDFITLTARAERTPPHAPQNFAATANAGGTVSLSWTANSERTYTGSGGEIITAYILTYGTVSTNYPNQGAAVITAAVGQAYAFTLRAQNVLGIGPAAVASVSIAGGVTPPSAPRNFAIVSRDARVGFVLEWDEPASWGGSTLSVYRVGLDINFNSEWATHETTDTRLTITHHQGSAMNLWVGGNPRFRILARSQAGENSGYASFQDIVVRTSPDAPNVRATALASGTEISVSWSRANNQAQNNASVYALRIGSVNSTLVASITSTVVGNLQGNTAYTLSVRGISQYGEGLARVLTLTTAAGAPPPATAPDAPTVNVATTPAGATPATVTLSWSAPANGGSSITGYILGYGTVSANLPASQTATAIGVSLGVAYTFTLQAANANGASSATVVGASIAAGVAPPSAPEGFTASAVAGGASLSWSVPASDGGASVTGYVLSYGAETVTLGAHAWRRRLAAWRRGRNTRLPCKRQTALAWGRRRLRA